MDSGDGFLHFPGVFSETEQQALLQTVLEIVRQAPFERPHLAGVGRPFQVEMTSAGQVGWWSDHRGHGYRPTHPASGRRWPAVPPLVNAMVNRLLQRLPGGRPARFHADSCLINRYRQGGRLGLHRDVSEPATTAPVVTLSLGDSARFMIGGAQHRDPLREVVLASGDGLVMSGAARHYYHGVAGILAGSSTLVPGGGRISLTIRQVWQRGQLPMLARQTERRERSLRDVA